MSRYELRRAMVAYVMRVEHSPAWWLSQVRAVCEAAGLDPSRCIPLGGATLDIVCASVVEEASNQSPRHVQLLSESIR